MPHVRSNRLRAIAVTTAKRSKAAPDIPTVGESIPGYEAALWFAVLGPKALPSAVVARWNWEIEQALQLPDIMQRMANDAVEPMGGSPERLRQVLQRDIAKWQNVIKTAGIKLAS